MLSFEPENRKDTEALVHDAIIDPFKRSDHRPDFRHGTSDEGIMVFMDEVRG